MLGSWFDWDHAVNLTNHDYWDFTGAITRITNRADIIYFAGSLAPDRTSYASGGNFDARRSATSMYSPMITAEMHRIPCAC